MRTQTRAERALTGDSRARLGDSEALAFGLEALRKRRTRGIAFTRRAIRRHFAHDGLGGRITTGFARRAREHVQVRAARQRAAHSAGAILRAVATVDFTTTCARARAFAIREARDARFRRKRILIATGGAGGAGLAVTTGATRDFARADGAEVGHRARAAGGCPRAARSSLAPATTRTGYATCATRTTVTAAAATQKHQTHQPAEHPFPHSSLISRTAWLRAIFAGRIWSPALSRHSTVSE